MLNPSLNRRPVTLPTFAVIVVFAICLTVPLAATQTLEPAAPPVMHPVLPKPVAVLAVPAAPSAPVVASIVRPKPLPSPVRVAPQEGAASIFGTVRDATGAVVPGATAILSFVEGKAHQEITSDEGGRFEFSKLLPGRYLLQVQLPGFRGHAALIEVQGNQRFEERVTLQVGTISQTVEVSASGTPKPGPKPAAPTRIRVGGNVQAARLISPVKPIYPQSARDAGVEGNVLLQAIIGGDGRIMSLQVLNEGQVDPELASAARGAVSQWQYRPTLLNNTPVEVVTTITVTFTLVQ